MNSRGEGKRKLLSTTASERQFVSDAVLKRLTPEQFANSFPDEFRGYERALTSNFRSFSPTNIEQENYHPGIYAIWWKRTKIHRRCLYVGQASVLIKDRLYAHYAGDATNKHLRTWVRAARGCKSLCFTTLHLADMRGIVINKIEAYFIRHFRAETNKQQTRRRG